VTLLKINEFAFDVKSEKFTLLDAQKELSVFGGITNRYLAKRVGNGTDELTKKSRIELESLLERQKKFVAHEISKSIDFKSLKKEGLEIIDEYDRILLQNGIFK
jgi:hypothetical protein